MKNRGILLFVLCSSFMTACSHFGGDESFIRNRNKDYLRSVNGSVPKIPAPLNEKKITFEYQIQAQGSVKPPSILPPGSLAAKMAEDKKSKS